MNGKPVKDIKVYVEVTSVTKANGDMKPRSLVWEDGHTYNIDKVTDVRQAHAMRAGGQGDRYTIWVDGKMSYLYFERSAALTGSNIGRWFVERRKA